ncbi:MAG: phosphate transport system regulatory protein PhoU, partial [Elusimicrobia bacterium]|nr:phosphate transport system regulatory protein PhoU [Elusimicrobiota bacterium]MBD3412082.1 phosphate transport system regulatory protein PhoU [Elusimicrobiota bacterium]
MLEERIVTLKRDIVEYASIVENMVEKSMRALFQKERSPLDEVIEKDEPVANEREIKIDEDCTTMIAQFQPKAGNLRTILMIMKMNNDLERIADHAVNIAQSSLFLIERPLVKPYIDLPKISENVIRMLKDSINSFI